MSTPPWRSAESEPEQPEPDTSPTEQPKTKKRKKKKKKSHVAVVAQALVDGERETSVRGWLEKKGLAPDEIDAVVARARDLIRERVEEREAEHEAIYEGESREERRKNLLYGALWFGGGLLLTIGTYSAADDAGGGRYVLAWGPMLYGGYKLLKSF
jgi:hypothetical protein